MIDYTVSCKNGFSKTLYVLLQSVPENGMTLHELIERLQHRGLLVLCMILTIPFLLPVSIPGSSTPFGLAIFLIGLGVISDKSPRLPKRIMKFKISMNNLIPMLEKGAKLFEKIERIMCPRIDVLTKAAIIRQFNSILLLFSALVLMFPLPLPLSNTLPAYSVLFLSAGSIEEDGLLIIMGYMTVVLSILYFGVLALVGLEGLQALLSR
ncbi:MAG: exopolysaccharide biosynthesis protein [Bacillota bacterium]